MGLRVAAAAPELVERLVLVNPATSFARALGGLPGAIAGTNLLSLFPEPLYQVGPYSAFQVYASLNASLQKAGTDAMAFAISQLLPSARLFAYQRASWHGHRRVTLFYFNSSHTTPSCGLHTSTLQEVKCIAECLPACIMGYHGVAGCAAGASCAGAAIGRQGQRGPFWAQGHHQHDDHATHP